MHRDVKIGLILGVLLLGLVAALFFRREKDETPALVGPARSGTSDAEAPLVKLDPPMKLEEVPSAQHSEEHAAAPSTEGTLLEPPHGQPPVAQLPGPLEGRAHLVPDAPHLPMRSGTAPSGTVPNTGEPSLQPNTPAPSPTVQRHRIAAGDTLWELAVRYLGDGARADEIYRANHSVLSSPDVLPLGKELVIPARTSPAIHRTTDQPSASAQRLAVTNPQRPSFVQRPSATQSPAVADRSAPARLQAPPVVLESRPSVRRSTAPRSRASTSTTATQYTVRDGDTLYSIARKIYNDASRWIDIYRANRSVLSNPDALRTGLTLHLPR